jgi:hypothetical protein
MARGPFPQTQQCSISLALHVSLKVLWSQMKWVLPEYLHSLKVTYSPLLISLSYKAGKGHEYLLDT